LSPVDTTEAAIVTPRPASGRKRGRSGLANRRIVVVANRMPVRRVQEGRQSRWVTSPGGLVAALAPMLRERGGAWIGWDGTAAERVPDKPPKPFEHEGMLIQPVAMTDEELDGFYYGFSNETLWPLYHDAIRFPTFHRHWWRPYRTLNERFAQATLAASGDDDLIWVQDYQLQLVPGLIREARPNSAIGFFLHIPFPPEELFAKMPWRRQILEGMLGADLVGFQTRLAAQNFVRAAKRFAGARGSENVLQYQGRRVRVAAFPISIDVARFAEKAAEPDCRARAEGFRASFDHRKIIMGVDRLDYTKGVDIRLRAFEEVLNRGNYTADDVVFIQVAVPTREKVEDYAELRNNVERLVGRINGEFATMRNIAVHYIYRSMPFDELLAAYLAADVMVVSPFRDGMNLVAKEYVASRLDNSGVLVLSEFAGAALELKQALMVNPYDIDGMATTFERALSLDPADARRRMAAMRRTVAKHDVFVWSQSFLEHLAEAARNPAR